MRSQGVEIAADGSDNITVILPTSGGNIQAVVKDSSGAAISGATVRVLAGTTVAAIGATNSKGAVLFGGLAAGSYTLAASLPGYDTVTTTVTVTDNTTSSSTVTLTSQTVNIVVSAGSGGVISPSGTTAVRRYGGSQSYTFTPDPGYAIASVTVDNVAVTPTPSLYTFTNVVAAHTIAATFTQQIFTITLNAGANGSMTPHTGSTTTAPYGSNQQFDITPGTGYVIASVTVDGQAVSSTSPVTLSNITAAHTITATFKLQHLTSFTIQLLGMPSNSTYTADLCDINLSQHYINVQVPTDNLGQATITVPLECNVGDEFTLYLEDFQGHGHGYYVDASVPARVQSFQVVLWY